MLDKKTLNKKDIKISLVFMILAGLGGFLTALYQAPLVTPAQIGSMTKEAFIALFTGQSAILYGLILGFLGLKLSRATNLNKGILGNIYSKEKYKINLNSTMFSIGFGFVNALVITFCEKFIFAKLIPEIANTTHVFSPLYLLSGIVYGGIVEEIMLRLFFMSLVTFILYKIFAKKADIKDIPQSIYLAGIILSALIFGIAHLPAVSLTFSVTFIVIFRVIFGNAFAGILFGYLYWKKGFEYSVIAHMFSHIFMQLIFLPILF